MRATRIVLGQVRFDRNRTNIKKFITGQVEFPLAKDFYENLVRSFLQKSQLLFF